MHKRRKEFTYPILDISESRKQRIDYIRIRETSLILKLLTEHDLNI